MNNIRRINPQQLWLFSGLLAVLLVLIGALLLLPTSSAHAAPTKETKGKETITCTTRAAKGKNEKQIIVNGTNGQKTTINCSGGQGTIICTGGPITSEKVGKEQGHTEVQGKGKEATFTVQGKKGSGTPVTCAVGKK